MQSRPIGHLIVALAVAIAPLAFQLPFWTMGWCAAFWAYLLFHPWAKKSVSSTRFRMAAIIVGMAAVLATAGLRFDGRDFMVLLAVLAGIKPLEIKGRRDCMATIFLAYFLVITSLFVFENLAMILYLFISVWVTTAVLIRVNDPAAVFGAQLKLSGKLVLTAVPLMILLFFLFPRFSSNFWGAPWSRNNRSGFASTMNLGDVSRLVLVDEPAFNVSFNSPAPTLDQLYWRGIVFQHFNGRTWIPARYQTARRNSVSGTDLTDYSIILEPHGQRYLFALDLPAMVNNGAAIMKDHTLLAHWPIRQRFHYGAASYINYRQNAVNTPAGIYLQLPAGRNPKTLALAKSWSRLYADPKKVVAAALDYFGNQGFVYSLQPGRLGSQVVDDFLFRTKKGFCEHFATAFAVLMRGAGVPTRVVGGYQGGRWNTVGKFLTVRHSDAHVWCEVWLAGQGWVRVDPTFKVAPDRIDVGIENALAQESLLDFLHRDKGNLLARWTETARLTWETINIRWNMWFMGFSTEDQLAILKRLGLSVDRLGLWILFILVPPVLIAAVIFLRRFTLAKPKGPGKDATLKVYLDFQRKMTQVGLPKPSHQGPLDYARFITTKRPALKEDVDDITSRYIALRYGHGDNLETLKNFRRRVRNFNPRRILSQSAPNV